MIQRCLLCGHSGLDVESRIVSDESPLGYHREPRCVDVEACEERLTGHAHEFVNVVRDGLVVDNPCACGKRPIDLLLGRPFVP